MIYMYISTQGVNQCRSFASFFHHFSTPPCLVGPHAVMTAIAQEVVHQLHRAQTLQAVALLVDLGVVGRARLTHLVDAELEEVVVNLGVVIAKGLLEVRVLAKVEGQVEDVRAGTALLDTEGLPVVQELGVVVVEGVLQIRILVVIEVNIEHQVLRSDGGHGCNSKSAEAHGGDHALRTAKVAEVPQELTRSQGGQERIHGLIDLGVVGRARLTELVDAELEEVVVNLGVVIAKGLLEVRIVGQVEGQVKHVRAGTALLDTEGLPVVQELGVVVVEGVLQIRILVVIEVDIEHNILHVHGRISGNTAQYHFVWFFFFLLLCF